jgi:3-deoxy-D-manno-octulosonate 8-phosphate phosphatase KdsC-like HAD superfamily phosphatase
MSTPDEVAIDTHNRQAISREIMGRLSLVEHELGLIEGDLDDLGVYGDVALALRVKAAAAIVAVRELQRECVEQGMR